MSVKSTQFLTRDEADSFLVDLASKCIDLRGRMDDESITWLLQEMDDCLNGGESFRNYMIVEEDSELLKGQRDGYLKWYGKDWSLDKIANG